MKRYVNDLIRNKPFVKSIKKLLKIRNKEKGQPVRYEDMSKEQKARHDYFNKEIGEIIDGYERLRRRSRKLLHDDYMRIASAISNEYSIDGSQIQYIEYLVKEKDKKDPDISKYMEELAKLDICKVDNLYDSQLNPLNRAEEIIHLDNQRQLFIEAYPVALCINPKASKRDVLDFIEKNWKQIDNAMYDFTEGKKLKYRGRKYKQELLDLIWDNQHLSNKELENLVNEKFSSFYLTDNEISKLKSIERKKRLSSLT